MTSRIATTVRVLALALPCMAIAGAAPATRPVMYGLRCHVSDASHKADLSPVLWTFEGKPCQFTVGGQAPVAGGRHLEFGTRIEASVSLTTHGDAVLDLTLSRTGLAGSKPDATVSGTTARTVRTVQLGRPTRLDLGDPAGTVLDVTVERH